MVVLSSFDLSYCKVVQLLFQLINFIHKLQSIVLYEKGSDVLEQQQLVNLKAAGWFIKGSG